MDRLKTDYYNYTKADKKGIIIPKCKSCVNQVRERVCVECLKRGNVSLSVVNGGPCKDYVEK